MLTRLLLKDEKSGKTIDAGSIKEEKSTETMLPGVNNESILVKQTTLIKTSKHDIHVSKNIWVPSGRSIELSCSLIHQGITPSIEWLLDYVDGKVSKEILEEIVKKWDENEDAFSKGKILDGKLDNVERDIEKQIDRSLYVIIVNPILKSEY